MADKQATKEYLDNFLSGSLQETLERKAQQYKKHGMEKQAKKVRAFKKQVREMVGSLWKKPLKKLREWYFTMVKNLMCWKLFLIFTT